ncbi:MAG: uracil-DNA glycosylase, 4 family protein [Rhodocyclales bacterium]|nr:uracil-DNA glycosylase, 4 family protein [Rhodocyclales bacterium]
MDKSLDKSRILAEMGLKPVWRLRQPPVSAPHATQDAEAAIEPVAASPVDRAISAAQATSAPVESSPVAATQQRSGIAGLDWDGLASTVSACRACGLCEKRKQAVLGVGDRQADWMFVGEGPGAEEDERGEPFVGQAGKLLDAMLEAASLKRGENVYITNAVKCRPPGNRTPEAIEIATCRPYLERQIELVQPKLLIALGRPAAQILLGRELSIASARRKVHRYAIGDIPVVVTYHPAYLLRTLPDKAKAWEDLCFAMDQIALAG